MFEHAFPSQGTHGVFAFGRKWITFGRTRPGHSGHSVNVACRKCNDTAGAKMFTNDSGQIGIRSPCLGLCSTGTKFYPDQINDIGHHRQTCHEARVEQVTRQCADAPRIKSILKACLGKAAGRNNSPFETGSLSCPASHSSQGGSHLAASSQDEDIALDAGQRFHQGLGGIAQSTFQFFLVANHR